LRFIECREHRLPMTLAARATNYRAAVRLFRARHAGAGAAGTEVTLERLSPSPEPARLAPSAVVEGERLAVHTVPGDPEPGFAAFLDGIQRSRVVAWEGGVPIVHGTVAAVIRERRGRRLATWRSPAIDSVLCIPRAFVPPELWELATAPPFDAADTSLAGSTGDGTVRHPAALQEGALKHVTKRREELELQLAREWFESESAPLYVDGGIGRMPAVAHERSVAGVIKSHRTLYVDGDDLPLVFALRPGERTSVQRVDPFERRAVLSWYLRLHAGDDPMFGLVRVESPMPTAPMSSEAYTQHADELSRWVLAERAPVARPDGRWSTLVYGVRDCEEFLRATIGA
jgi:hypothetical protein